MPNDASAHAICHQKQLFFDNAAVETMDGLRRVFFQAEKVEGNPIIRGDGPWEMGVLHPNTALYGPKMGHFYLWYRATSAPVGQPSNDSVCYATSTDGVHWEKPDLGAGSNIMDDGPLPVMAFLKDASDDPSERIILVHDGSTGMSLTIYTGAYGNHWTKKSETCDLRKIANTPPDPDARYIFATQCWAGKDALRWE